MKDWSCHFCRYLAEHHIEEVIADAIREALCGKEEVGVTFRSPPNHV